MLKFICYPKCTTCQKAKRWLDDNKIEYEFRDIKEDNPSFEKQKLSFIFNDEKEEKLILNYHLSE